MQGFCILLEMSSFLSIIKDVRKKKNREHALHKEQKGAYLLLVVNTGFYLNIEILSVYVKKRYSGVSCTLRPQHRNLQ